MSREIHVTAGVIIRQGRLLAARRPEGAVRGGLWELPGGKVEPGESREECLQRELLEELAVAVDVGQHLTSVVHDYGDLCVQLHAYRCQISRGTPTALQHAELRWLEPGQLDTVNWSTADRPIVERARQLL